MKNRLAILFAASLLTVSSSAFAAPRAARSSADLILRVRNLFETWQALDPEKAAPFYAKDADLAFFDIAPLKYTGWTEYGEGVKKAFADFASLKLTLGNDLRATQRGNLAWTTATWQGQLFRKDGGNMAVEGRWTGVWEKRGKEWLLVHEHMSMPLPPPPAGQSLYTRLGGYDALAAVTDDFIGRLLGDKGLSRFFMGVGNDSRKRIRQLVVDQLCEATGGPCFYIGRTMKAAHQGLGITENDWKAAVDLLVATLEKFKVPQKEKDEVLAAISGLKADIITSAGSGGR